MRAVLQRVTNASVEIKGRIKSEIQTGLLILLGIETEDNSEDIRWLCRKIANMRIFNDEQNAMNLSVKAVEGEVMVVSQFTLHASVKKGNRPSFIKAAKPPVSEPLYEDFVRELEGRLEKSVATGTFGADMQISLCNDGPVTIIVDSKDRQ